MRFTASIGENRPADAFNRRELRRALRMLEPRLGEEGADALMRAVVAAAAGFTVVGCAPRLAGTPDTVLEGEPRQVGGGRRLGPGRHPKAPGVYTVLGGPHRVRNMGGLVDEVAGASGGGTL